MNQRLMSLLNSGRDTSFLHILSGSKKLPLEKSKIPAYRILTVAKNSGRDLHLVLTKIRSCILLNGFFYACDKIRCVMTACVDRESSDSSFSLLTIVQTLKHRLSPPRFAPIAIVSRLTKETTQNV